ncbi:hypothetical protein SNEBB_001274 [Seison nebaliae]|nr:hypothetical protein SNEBB_001274 [Seison nebaliae]
MSKQRSKVRDHYSVDTVNKVLECNHCDYVIQNKTSTSTLWKHLHSKHPTAYGQAKNMDDAQILCNNLITLMVATDLIPCSIVESEISLNLLNNWRPGLKLPCRKKITENIGNMKNKLFNDLIEIAKDQKLSITSDCWSHVYF